MQSNQNIGTIAARNFLTVQAEKYSYAQSDCPTIVKQAVETVSAECSKAGRNKLCYGNSTIQVVFQPGAGSPTFQSPGDTVDESQIKQFTLGAMDITNQDYRVLGKTGNKDIRRFDNTQADSSSIITSLNFSADGKYALTFSGNESAARLWDVQTGKLIKIFNDDSYTLAELSPDGKFVLLAPLTQKPLQLVDSSLGVIANLTKQPMLQ